MLLPLALASSLVVLAGCSSAPEPAPTSSASSPAADQATTPDVAGIPDPVAEVDGVPISKIEFVETYEGQFSQAAAQAATTGQPVDQALLKEQTLTGMVSTELLSQAADKHKLTASKKETDAALAEIAKSSSLTPAKFLEAMKKQGVDAKLVDEQLVRQVKIQKLIKEMFDPFTATDEEVRKAYDAAVQAQQQSDAATGAKTKTPPYKDVKATFKKQALDQKENTAVQSLIDDLRAKAKVVSHLEVVVPKK